MNTKINSSMRGELEERLDVIRGLIVDRSLSYAYVMDVFMAVIECRTLNFGAFLEPEKSLEDAEWNLVQNITLRGSFERRVDVIRAMLKNGSLKFFVFMNILEKMAELREIEIEHSMVVVNR